MRRSLLVLSVVILSGVLGTRTISQTRSPRAQLAVVGATIHTSPTEEPIRNGVVLIEGARSWPWGAAVPCGYLKGPM